MKTVRDTLMKAILKEGRFSKRGFFWPQIMGRVRPRQSLCQATLSSNADALGREMLILFFDPEAVILLVCFKRETEA